MLSTEPLANYFASETRERISNWPTLASELGSTCIWIQLLTRTLRKLRTPLFRKPRIPVKTWMMRQRRAYCPNTALPSSRKSPNRTRNNFFLNSSINTPPGLQLLKLVAFYGSVVNKTKWLAEQKVSKWQEPHSSFLFAAQRNHRFSQVDSLGSWVMRVVKISMREICFDVDTQMKACAEIMRKP